MTDEDYNTIGADLIKMFGDKLPNPEHEPIRFHYCFKLYILEMRLQNGTS